MMLVAVRMYCVHCTHSIRHTVHVRKQSYTSPRDPKVYTTNIPCGRTAAAAAATESYNLLFVNDYVLYTNSLCLWCSRRPRDRCESHRIATLESYVEHHNAYPSDRTPETRTVLPCGGWLCVNTYGLRQLKRTPAMPDTIGECERKRRLLVLSLNIPFSLFKCLNSNCS